MRKDSNDSMEYEPLVSIVVIVDTEERYLSDCLETIAEQDYNHIEVIVVGIGLRKETIRILQTYITKDSRYFYYEPQEKNCLTFWSIGIELSHGEYMCFVNARDLLHYQHISTLVKSILSYQSEVCLTGSKYFSDKKYINIHKPLRGIYYSKSKRSVVVEVIRKECCMSFFYNKLYKISFLKQIYFPLYRTYEGYGIMVQLFTISNTIFAVSGNTTYFFRERLDIETKEERLNKIWEYCLAARDRIRQIRSIDNNLIPKNIRQMLTLWPRQILMCNYKSLLKDKNQIMVRQTIDNLRTTMEQLEIKYNHQLSIDIKLRAVLITISNWVISIWLYFNNKN